MNKEALFQEIKEKGMLDLIPSHEIEELLGIHVDDFDARKRRHGYPDSRFYRDFGSEEAGKDKLIIDRVLSIGLDNMFVYWRANYPGKTFAMLIGILCLCMVSTVSWLFFLAKNSYDGTYYSLMALVICSYLLWAIKRGRFSSLNTRDYYEKARKNEYPGDIPMIKAIMNG